MTTVYTRVIQNLPAYREIDGNSDVVFLVNWTMVGTDDVFTSSTPMTTQVPYVAGQPFTPYADLTQEQVQAWIEQYTPADTISYAQNSIQRIITEQQTIATPPLPWVPPPDPTPPDPTPPNP